MDFLLNFTKEVFKGKTIFRILFNWNVKKYCRNLKGVCVDFAGGRNPSYKRHWDIKCDKFIKTAYRKEDDPDVVVDLNKPIPFYSNFADNAFLFNALNVLDNPKESLKEICRILKPEGTLFLSTSLIANEMPEPHDYYRFTNEGLERVLQEAGFKQIKIIRIGERVSSATHLLYSCFVFSFIRFFAFGLALLLDKIFYQRKNNRYPCPIGYFVVAKK